jgi:hypothetical protein
MGGLARACAIAGATTHSPAVFHLLMPDQGPVISRLLAMFPCCTCRNKDKFSWTSIDDPGFGRPWMMKNTGLCVASLPHVYTRAKAPARQAHLYFPGSINNYFL